MSHSVVTTVASFPQSGTNRSREDAIREIASYHGGEDRAVIQDRAGKAWEAAIREYNTWLWRFNRVTADITLASPSPAGSATYDLSTDFAEPNRAKLVDSNGKERDLVQWIPFTEWLVLFPDQSSPGARPLFYTAQNVHETGKVTIDPPPATTLVHPTLRLYYFRRILIPASGARLNVPVEVDEGIFQLGLAKMTHRQKGFDSAIGEYARAAEYRVGLEHRFRDFPDIPQ